MAKVQKTTIVQDMIKALGLSPMAENLPLEVAKTLQPVFVTRDAELKQIFQSSATNILTLTIPQNKEWDILYGLVRYTADANVGDRRAFIRVFAPSGDLVWSMRSAAVQTASTTEQYNFHKGSADATEGAAAYHFLPIPAQFLLNEGYYIEFKDAANVSAADSITISLIVKERYE